MAKPTESEVVNAWRERIVKPLSEDEEHDWFSLWVGFVIGFGREDLATNDHYMRLGFPVEMES
jgi:hypothetical protein